MNKPFNYLFSILSFSGFLSLSPQSLLAHDHPTIEENFPLSLESAYPIPYLGREFQTYFQYELEDDGMDKFTYEARLEFGFPENGEIKIGAPYIFGGVEPDGWGDVELEFLYNFNQEGLYLPAFSLSGGVEIPIEDDSHGYDPFLKVLLTKTVGQDYLFDQVHLNLAYYFNDDVDRGERDYRYEAVIGYSVLVTTSMVVLADIKHEKDFDKGEDQNLFEIGLRFQATPLNVISVGTGFGFGEDSPDFVMTVGLQHAF